MNSRLKINEKEAEILNIIGKNANLSNKEIAKAVKYKRTDTISKKLKKFKKMNILKGPYTDINLSAVGKNQLYSVYVNVTFSPEDRDFIFEVLQCIPGMRWIFPSTDLDRFFVYYQVNHYKHIGGLMKLLHKKGFIQYDLAASLYKWILQNPDFFGPVTPSGEGLSGSDSGSGLGSDPGLGSNELPDIAYRKYPSIKWNITDLTIMQYLQVRSDSFIEIARKEYKWYKNILKYYQIKYSTHKIKNNNLIESEDYHISPLPREECSTMLLLLESDQKKKLLQIMERFGKGCCLHKSYTLAGTMGIMFLWTFPEVATNLLHVFDQIEYIQPRMYFLRSHETPYLRSLSFEADLFNTDTQRWEFPYSHIEKAVEDMIKRKK
ncbi:MAG: hypothetical protein PVF58_15675 [Candidatus Methanofastidiosia archaeon]|jgi:DNA-binding Lrp family transcriptional regulator